MILVSRHLIIFKVKLIHLFIMQNKMKKIKSDLSSSSHMIADEGGTAHTDGYSKWRRA